MLEKIISMLLIVSEIYLACGFLFAIYFLTKGIHKIDEDAHGSPVAFRLLIAPGVIVFWIPLLKKIISHK